MISKEGETFQCVHSCEFTNYVNHVNNVMFFVFCFLKFLKLTNNASRGDYSFNIYDAKLEI